MDLLQSYGSSDDDDDSSVGDRSISPPTPIKKTTVHGPGALPPAMPSPQKVTAKKAASVSNGMTNIRGKKLISLHSVLPPHILEQLTRREATGSLSDSSDDDDDGDDNDSNIQSDPQKKAKTQATKKSAATSQDPGIASFLSALSSAKTMNATTSLSKMKNSNSATSSKLGAAFVSVTSTTTTRTKKDGTKLSIKSSYNASSPNEPRLTPTGQTETGEGSPSPSGYTPLSLSPRTAFHPFRNAAVAAAPPVPNSSHYNNASLGHFVPPPPPSIMDIKATESAEPSNAFSGGGNNNSRSKKRQLQKALRSGQLEEALAQSDNTASLEQAAPTAYVPQQETYAVPNNGVKVVTTTMYNPKAGTDVQVNLGAVRARGKNQINQLMASAANFELQQARQGGKSNQRAGAKRKYGW
jgi:hypothetical protein